MSPPEAHSARGLTANRIAWWDGARWVEAGDGVRNIPMVTALTVVEDGTRPVLYAGGRFNSAGGVTANRIAAWRCQ